MQELALIKEAIKNSVESYFKTYPIEEFKKTSFFMSNNT